MKAIPYGEETRLCLFAISDINEGEEILYNYGDGSYPWRLTKRVSKSYSKHEQIADDTASSGIRNSSDVAPDTSESCGKEEEYMFPQESLIDELMRLVTPNVSTHILESSGLELVNSPETAQKEYTGGVCLDGIEYRHTRASKSPNPPEIVSLDSELDNSETSKLKVSDTSELRAEESENQDTPIPQNLDSDDGSEHRHTSKSPNPPEIVSLVSELDNSETSKFEVSDTSKLRTEESENQDTPIPQNLDSDDGSEHRHTSKSPNPPEIVSLDSGLDNSETSKLEVSDTSELRTEESENQDTPIPQNLDSDDGSEHRHTSKSPNPPEIVSLDSELYNSETSKLKVSDTSELRAEESENQDTPIPQNLDSDDGSEYCPTSTSTNSSESVSPDSDLHNSETPPLEDNDTSGLGRKETEQQDSSLAQNLNNDDDSECDIPTDCSDDEEPMDVLRDITNPGIYIRKVLKCETDSRGKKKKTVRVHNSYQTCGICNKKVSNFSQHVQRKNPSDIHNKNIELQTVLKMEDKKEQKRYLTLLRNKYNHAANLSTLSEKKGELFLDRRPTEKLVTDNYGPCPHCYAWVVTKALYKH